VSLGASRVEPAWLTLEAIIDTNRVIVTSTGEPHLVLNPGLLKSAGKRCENHWYYDGVDDVVVLAIKLLLGIAQNHPFEQGNKHGFCGGYHVLAYQWLCFDGRRY
jgi:death-on-curing protein